MNVAGIQSGVVGMALFDMWFATVEKSQKAGESKGSPLVAVVADAFENYIKSAEVGMAAQIAGAATYALNPNGASVHGVTQQDIAPFLALNLMA